MAKHRVKPVTFFLNETHELSPVEEPSGGRLPQFGDIRWAQKARHIHRSMETVASKVAASKDPLKDHRFFVLALPEPTVPKKSKDEKKAPTGEFDDPTDFGGDHGKVFDRLGLDLLQVTSDGRAVVHADKEKFDQLSTRSETLDSLGVREQSRWVRINSFELVPVQLRVDDSWLSTFSADELSEIIIELQPVLTNVDADKVLRAIADVLSRKPGQALSGTGTDFSGRHWFRGKATKQAIREFAREFFSIQSIHPPHYSLAAAKTSIRTGQHAPRPVAIPRHFNVAELPCVAVVDFGVPDDHPSLKPFRRGRFNAQNVARGAVGDHGSFVCSRVVFGDHESDEALQDATGQCAFYDVMVGRHPSVDPTMRHVDDKLVLPALEGTKRAADDVRVFNLSFSDVKAAAEFSEVDVNVKRALVRDLDNFAFDYDCLIIVAAGNSAPGLVPNVDYPEHYQDERWGLGPWACGFNTLVCGSFVSNIGVGGLVQNRGWPSPFTRIGPGFCDAPTPSFSAPGGNTDENYQYRPGLGVWTFSASGLPEDHSGSSYAAPLLARQAALLLHDLQEKCVQGTRPFAVTARAFLTLTATRPTNHPDVNTLVKKTLGVGEASSHRLTAPESATAVYLWQGYIESPRDMTRVQLPIPLEWLRDAEEPVLRLVVCSDPPVNDVARHSWACRRINALVRPGPEAPALRRAKGEHPSFPVMIREYALEKYRPGAEREVDDNIWMLEFSYDEIAPYLPATDFDPRQRVAFAAELVDQGENPLSPQAAIQLLPIAASMTRLSIQPTPVRTPIIIKTRV